MSDTAINLINKLVLKSSNEQPLSFIDATALRDELVELLRELDRSHKTTSDLYDKLEKSKRLSSMSHANQVIAHAAVMSHGDMMEQVDRLREENEKLRQALAWFEPREYVAANLLEALSKVPDTGDWHGQLRHWCEANKGESQPNLADWPRYEEIRNERDELRAKLKTAREGVARYVNSQGRHLYESWRDHLVECCDLERGSSGPYETAKATEQKSG